MFRIVRLFPFLLILAAVLVCFPGSGQAISLEDLGDLFAANTVTGATIIIHGWQPALITPEGGDSMLSLAMAIRDKAATGPDEGWLVDMFLEDEHKDSVVSGSSDIPADGSTGLTGHVVILIDWAVESDDLAFGWIESTGDAIFNLLNILKLADPEAGTSVNLHFISHSYGSGPMSEAVERLTSYGITVDHLTYIDPHDYDQDMVGSNENSARQWSHGRPYDVPKQASRQSPASYGATVWKRVNYAETYYETRGLNNINPFNTPVAPESWTVPRGRAVPGAFNLFLTGMNKLPTSYSTLNFSGDHSYTWNCFYLGTVLGVKPEPDCETPADGGVYANTGFYYSRLGGGSGFRPGPDFFGTDQGFVYDVDPNPDIFGDLGRTNVPNTTYANDMGDPVPVEIAKLDLLPDEFEVIRWSPEWNRFDVYNGDFQHRGVFPFDDVVPGWLHHGGDGTGKLIKETGDNVYLELTATDPSRTHNRLYVPPNATSVRFRLRVIGSMTTDDELHVSLGTTVLDMVSADGTENEWKSQRVLISNNLDLRGSVQTLSFEIVDSDTNGFDGVVDIDDVRFQSFVPLLPALPAAGIAVLAGLLALAGGFMLRRNRVFKLSLQKGR